MPEQERDKVEDFYRDLNYEKRVVAFYDVLGWRSEIANAGADAHRIGELRRLILVHSRILRLPVRIDPVNVSTFSDNVVISLKPGMHIPYFLRALAFIQVMSASRGFLLRGGVTFGNVVHDSEVVFGPALNRAYELESTVARYPRIVIDQSVNKFGKIAGFNDFEGNIHFLDPFNVGFIERFLKGGGLTAEVRQEHGLPEASKKLKGIPADILLKSILNQLKERIRKPMRDPEWEKVAWLFDRIATRLGVPLAKSYPRVRLNS